MELGLMWYQMSVKAVALLLTGGSLKYRFIHVVTFLHIKIALKLLDTH